MNKYYTEQLFAIESDAQAAMNDIAKENERYLKNAQENINKKIAVIEHDRAETIRRLVRETENHTAARIEQIEEEYRAKSEAYEKEFAKKRKNLRGKLFHDVLYGH